MAGDWIKFELTTLDKPEVIAMADLLGTSTYDVVGRLLRVWGWFDQQTRNGNAVSVTGSTLKRFIDGMVGSQGFASSMQKVGWLTDDGAPNFDRHNGKPAKDRALTQSRVKRLRNDQSVTSALPEKRREEKRIKNIKKSPKTSLPENFSLSTRVIDWATEKGFGNLQRHLDHFRLQAAAHDYRYVDWDAALMNAISNDWAKVNGKPADDPFAGAV